MSITSELVAIQEASEDGILYPREALDWARKHPKSDLHAALEWDDQKAADEHRLWQIRRLIKIYVVADDGEPAVVSLSIDRVESGGYRRVDDVVRSRKLSQIMLSDALAELERVRSRYERVKELTGVWETVDKVRRSASKKGARREQRISP